VLVVEETRRLEGIGKLLLDRASRLAEAGGCDYMELDSAFVRERAHLFYEKLGFTRTGYIFGRPLDGSER
jgi:GNAT superfamily N-acetyltransferase